MTQQGDGHQEDAVVALLRRYYDAFNAGDRDTMFSLMTEDVVHDINQGGAETGIGLFRKFMEEMDRCYRERITELVVFSDGSGTRAAAGFTVHGEYVATGAGLPPARGQKYTLPAGAFFTLRDGRIARVTTYYNLNAWCRMVAGPPQIMA